MTDGTGRDWTVGPFTEDEDAALASVMYVLGWLPPNNESAERVRTDVGALRRALNQHVNQKAEARADALDAIETTCPQWVDGDGVHWFRAYEVRAILTSGEGPAPEEADPPASAPGPLDPAAALNHAISESIATTPPRKKRK